MIFRAIQFTYFYELEDDDEPDNVKKFFNDKAEKDQWSEWALSPAEVGGKEAIACVVYEEMAGSC